jgi:hypothetical protein
MKNSYELFLELSLELFKDDHTINSTSIRKIMQNHPYTNSSKTFHWNFYKTKKIFYLKYIITHKDVKKIILWCPSMDNVVCKCPTSTRHTIKTTNVTCPGNLCPYTWWGAKVACYNFLAPHHLQRCSVCDPAKYNWTKNIIQRLPVWLRKMVFWLSIVAHCAMAHKSSTVHLQIRV